MTRGVVLRVSLAFQFRTGGGGSKSDVDRLAELCHLVEAGTEALVLVDMATKLKRAVVSALWAVDNGEGALAEAFLLAALEEVRRSRTT